MAGRQDKRERFVLEYMIDNEPQQAAIRAGYSPKTASEQASRLLHKSEYVMRRLAEERAKQSVRTGITSDRVLREIAKIAFANAGDVIDFSNGSVMKSATMEDMAALAEVRVKIQGGEVIGKEVRMCDKVKALDMLCKHLGLYDKPPKNQENQDAPEESGVIVLPDIQVVETDE